MGTEKVEWLKCKRSFSYFVNEYCYIYDATKSVWIRFALWPEQEDVVSGLQEHRLNVILKARQLGLTWLVLCYILWRMLFHPIFTALVFSRRETEAIYLLSNQRLRGIYNRLPDWMKARQIISDSSHVMQLSNDSIVYGFPTSAGDSYTASFAFVDEADLVPDLDRLLNAVKPTIDGGGGMVLLSRVDKETPNSPFKRIYIAARSSKNAWNDIFLPWMARPDRDQAWYEEQRDDSLARTGGLDDLYQQYPATPEEALKPPTIDRRLPYSWLRRAYEQLEPLEESEDLVGIPNVRIYREPKYGEEFVVGADPAEGNPESDDSSAHVLEMLSGEECACLSGKIEPTIFAGYLNTLSQYYNDADILPERNNHGHAVILALEEIYNAPVMLGFDGRAGWVTSGKSKAQMYTDCADALREMRVIIHSESTLTQLASIGGSKLEAPEGSFDDEATSFALGCSAIALGGAVAEYGESPTKGHRG